MSLFHFCNIKKRNFSFFSRRKNMVRQKARKTVEDLYTAVPPPGSLTAAATMRFDDQFLQNSKNNKTEKTNICIHNTVTGHKKPKGRSPIEKKDQKTLINEETLLGRSKKTEGLTTNNNIHEETEKDEDTEEEFFGMIKDTVKRAVEKSLQAIITPILRDISKKLDDIWDKVSTNENSLEKIQPELINKIIHYGEENSRHFRYLCMKSEYDKMFYQHQNVMTSAGSADARQNLNNLHQQQLVPSSEPLAQTIHEPKPIQQFVQLPTKPIKSSTLPMTCNCHSRGLTNFDCTQRSKLSVSSKSSDMGIREVKDLLEQLQKFYNQHNHEQDDQKDELGNVPLNVPDQDDSADGDEDDESSDDLSSPSIEENIGAGGDT